MYPLGDSLNKKKTGDYSANVGKVGGRIESLHGGSLTSFNQKYTTQQRKKEKRKEGRGTNVSFGEVSFEKTNKQTNTGQKRSWKFFFSEMVSQLERITEAGIAATMAGLSTASCARICTSICQLCIYLIYIWVVYKGAANVPYIYTAGVISRQQEQHARSYFFFSVAYTHSNVTPS